MSLPSAAAREKSSFLMSWLLAAVLRNLLKLVI